jgi:LysR family cys regulon transcriptional activator
VNLRQLKSLVEIVDRGLRITGAAAGLNRSQSSLTRQVQELERELGIDLFVRSRNRILGITPKGQEVVNIARRMLVEAQNMRRVGEEGEGDATGSLTVATTHTQARYTLPAVIGPFMRRYPNVRLALTEGNPAQCHELVARGAADLAISTETTVASAELVQLPCYRLNRSVITPPRHPLLRVKPLTIEAIARFPVITYAEGFSGRGIVNRAFSERGLEPNVVFSAIDADVSKAYVELGIGIAILATIAFDAKRDAGLRRIDARHLFKPSNLNIVVRRHSSPRGYTLAFVRMFAPRLRVADIEGAIAGRTPAADRTTIPDL